MIRGIFLVVLIVAFAATTQSKQKDKPKWREWTDITGVERFGPIRKCTKGNDTVIDNCIVQLIKELMPLVGAGIEEIDVPPLDPFEVKKYILQKSFGPINVTVLTKNIKIMGFTKYKYINFKLDSKNRFISFMYELPYLQAKAIYKVAGNTPFFPITGTGPAQVEIFNLKAEGKVHYTKIRNENNEEVGQVTKTAIEKLSIQDMNLLFQGLFDGNALLSSVFHYVAKRYAPQVFDILKPDIGEDAENMITNDLLNPILKNFPYLAEYIDK